MSGIVRQLNLQSRLRRMFNALAMLVEDGQCEPTALNDIAGKIARHDFRTVEEFAQDFEACIPDDNSFLRSQLQFELKNDDGDSDDATDTEESDGDGESDGGRQSVSHKRGFASDGHRAGTSAEMIVREAASAAEQALKRHKRWCAGAGMESSYPLMARGGLGWRSRPRDPPAVANNAIPAQYAEACGLGPTAAQRQATPRSKKKGHR